MTARPISDADCKAVVEALQRHGGNQTAAAEELEIPRTTLVNRQKEAKKRGLFHVCNFDTQTVDDVLSKAGVDLDIWEPIKVTGNRWGPEGEYNWQCKVELKRKVSKPVEDAAKLLAERLEKYAPKYPTIKRKKLSDPHMLEISVYDHHFGKLAWAPETGENYDLNIAEKLYVSAVKDLCAKVSGFPIERVLFPIGQDFFHIDNLNATTTAGTPQDQDGRYPKMFKSGVMACVHAIDYLRAIAPVEVLYVPGNHDRTVSWHLACYLEAWYRNCDDVTVDTAPCSRKYVTYGETLLGFAHGDTVKEDKLPLVMATESPDWSRVTHRELHVGHLHKKAEYRYVAADTHSSVVVRRIPSLCGTDKWHYDQGFLNSNRAAEAYLWSRANGYTGHFSANAGAL